MIALSARVLISEVSEHNRRRPAESLAADSKNSARRSAESPGVVGGVSPLLLRSTRSTANVGFLADKVILAAGALAIDEWWTTLWEATFFLDWAGINLYWHGSGHPSL